MTRGALLLLGGLATCLTALASGPALADPLSGSIRDAAYRAYRHNLLELAKGDTLDNDVAAFDRAYAVYARVQAQAREWFPQTADWEWELHVSSALDTAWSAPGCKLMIGAPLVRRLEGNDAALAFVIGHEVAHCVLDHSRTMIDALVEHEPRLAKLQAHELLWMLDGEIATVLRLAPVSRSLEDEADRVGMMIGAAAGYEPARMLDYFATIPDASGTLASTHNAKSQRIAALQALSAAAARLRQGEPTASQ